MSQGYTKSTVNVVNADTVDGYHANSTASNIPVLTAQTLLPAAILVSDRLGGSATNWSTAGSNNYDCPVVRIQTGTINTSNAAVVNISFPVAFSQVPIVVGSVLNNSTFATFHVESVTASAVGISAFDAGGNRVTTVAMFIAIGEA